MKKKKLTICFIGTAESVHTLKWAKYFVNQNHQVHLISYRVPVAQYDISGINFHFLNKIFPIQIWPFNTLLNLPFNVGKVKKLIKEIKPDIINAHYVTSYGTLASLLDFHPLVITAWGSDILITPKKFLPSKWSVKYALSKADLITCDAQHLKEAMIKLGIPASKIQIINFGVDIFKFSPGSKNENLKEKLGIGNSKIVISLRNLDPIYSVDTLIRAVPLVLKEIEEVKFIIIGKGPQENQLKLLTKELGVEDKVKFLGWVPNDQLPEYLRLADIYVSTSLSDGGIAASTAEAMACGLPVVITDTGENRKWIEDGENGFIIPVKNPHILAEKIIYLLKNESIRKEFGEKSRKIIEERNNYYKEMAKMEEIYFNLIKK
jgi:glycosyltransferase involved in cell wall biosynthesis